MPLGVTAVCIRKFLKYPLGATVPNTAGGHSIAECATALDGLILCCIRCLFIPSVPSRDRQLV